MLTPEVLLYARALATVKINSCGMSGSRAFMHVEHALLKQQYSVNDINSKQDRAREGVNLQHDGALQDLLCKADQYIG